MVFLGTELVNIILVLAYAGMTYASVLALRKFSQHNTFSNIVFWQIAKDIWYIWIKQNNDYVLERDGRGWAAAWAATSLFATSSLCFSILHLEYLVSGDLGAVGSVNSLLWFVTHFMGIAGISLAVYAAEHSHYNGHGVGYDDNDETD